MSIDLSRMPKIGFGLMRLPETDGVIDIDKVCKMADAYLEARVRHRVGKADLRHDVRAGGAGDGELRKSGIWRVE